MIDASGYQRILRNTPATLSMTVNDGSDLTDPGETTVTVTRLNGAVLKPAETETAGTGPAGRSLALVSADTAEMDLLRCDWLTANYGTITTYAEIVGNRLFSLVEARSALGSLLGDIDKYRDTALEEARIRLEDDFEQICGQSFIPRYAFEYFNGRGTQSLLLRHSSPRAQYLTIRSIEYRTIGSTIWTALTSDELADVFVQDTGLISRELGVPFWRALQNVRVGYEYGYRQVPPPIKRAALLVIASSTGSGAVLSNLPDRATSFSNENGTFRLLTPGVRGSWYGIGDVDRILGDYGQRTAGFA